MSMTDKRLELNLKEPFFKEDWAFKIDFSKCKNFEELFLYLDKVVIENINVGQLFRDMYKLPERCPLLDTFIPFGGFSQNTLNEFQIDGSFEKGFLEILNDIKNTSSSKEKNQKLFDYINSLTVGLRDIALKIINLTYSSYYTYNVSLSAVKDITEPFTNVPNLFIDTLLQFEFLGSNDSGEILPSECKNKIRELYNSSTEDQREILRYIIDRDFKIKMSEKSFHNVLSFTNKIRIIPYQRCEKMDKLNRIEYPALCERKADGKFQNIMYDTLSSSGFTSNRSGKLSHLNVIINELKEFDTTTKYFSSIWVVPLVINGEAIIKVPGCNAPDGIFPREIGNGLFNSYDSRYTTFKTLVNKVTDSFSKTSLNRNVEELIKHLLEWYRVAQYMQIEAWNIVPFNSWLGLNSGFDILKSKSYLRDFLAKYKEWCLTNNREIRIQEIEGDFVNNEEEALTIYNNNLKKGLEGCVVKNLKAIIEHGTSTEGIIKLKDFKECDLRVIGYNPGTDKYYGGVGSLICQTECGVMIVSATGLTDDQRGFKRLDPNDSSLGIILKEGWDNNCYNGLIVNVKYNMLSKDKKGKPSLSLPNVVEFRNDVVVAQTYEEIAKGKNKKNG